VVVDDAQLLDDLSAALVRHIRLATAAGMLVAVDPANPPRTQ
jgi:hypothetical protein